MPKRAFLTFLLALPLLAGDTVTTLLERKTLAAIAEYDRGFDGALGVAAIDLTTGRSFSYHGDTVFAQASSIKIPILLRTFRLADEGKLKLDERLTMTKADVAGGSGELQKRLADGDVTLTWREVAAAMMESSDNAATNKLIARVGMESVNRLMDELGFLNTRLRRVMMDSGAARRGWENVSTPEEMARLAELIHRGKAASEASTKEMLEMMSRVKAEMRKAVPEAIRVASKPGGVPGVSCETGIVYLERRPFAVSVMGAAMGEGQKSAVGDVTAIVLKHFQRLAGMNESGHKVY